MTRKYLYALGVVVGVALSSVAAAAPIKCTPVNAGSLTPWAEKACALDHSKNPESWVRGWASFDPATSKLEVHLKVETDSTTGGPCATISATLRDAEGHELATAQSSGEVCIGGKPAGKAVSYDWIQSQSVPTELASRAATIDVSVQRTKNINTIWGISLEEIAKAIKLIIKIFAS